MNTNEEKQIINLFNFTIMKTLADLFVLIAEQTAKNEGKALKYLFDVNTKYKWVSCHSELELLDETKSDVILSNASIDNEEELQMVYWTIKVKTRP